MRCSALHLNACTNVKERFIVGLFVYHERLLPFIAFPFKSDARLSNLDDAFKANREASGNERPDPSHSDVLVSVPRVSGDYEGYCDY